MEYQKRDDLILPEYGRNIQKMVDYALTISDREERTRCANAIIKSMGNLFPFLKQEEHRHKLWDHLAIMSDFKLDIDWPYEVVKKENMGTKPNMLKYNREPLRFRHYGRIVKDMIMKAVDMTDEEMKKAFINETATQMRIDFVRWNRDDVSKEKIAEDMNMMSDGRLNVRAEDLEIRDAVNIQSQQGNANKRHQNNKKRKQGNNNQRRR